MHITNPPTRYMSYGHPSYIGNHYYGYIKPYWWVYDHPLLREKNMSWPRHICLQIWKSMGRMTSHILWKNKKCSKPPTNTSWSEVNFNVLQYTSMIDVDPFHRHTSLHLYIYIHMHTHIQYTYVWINYRTKAILRYLPLLTIIQVMSQ